MKIGKLSNEQLERVVLRSLGARRCETALRPGVGVDCGAVRIGSQICVMSTDPITVPTRSAGTLAVQVSVNDVAASGAEPLAALLTVLAPPQADIEQIRQAVAEASEQAERENIEIIGGHTEVTDAVTRLVLSVVVVGRAEPGRVLTAAGARLGDDIVMTKFAGVEGTKIMLGDSAEGSGLGQMLSITREARVASDAGATAMHDATEGGVLGAVWEVAYASGLGATVYEKEIPLMDLTRELCQRHGLDPLRLIASGCLIIAHPDGARLQALLRRAGVGAAVIGRFTAGGMTLVRADGTSEELAPPQSDEIYKFSADEA